MGIFTNGPFGQKLDGVAEAYKKIHENTLKTAADIKPEDATVQEGTFADKFRAKRKLGNQEVELSSKGKQKAADKKDPEHQSKVKTAKKRWLEHVFYSKAPIVEGGNEPVLATKLKGAKYDALKPQSEVGKVKKTPGASTTV